MNIVIIEDESLTAEDLRDTIMEVAHEATIVKIVSSVKTAINYFQQQPTPDLIFSDIQLGDGLSFEIFKQVRISCPIIFCTAYDEHALAAFETNGIHYILKPFDTGKVSEAIEKFKKLKASFKVEEDSLNKLVALLNHRQEPVQSSILVYHQDKVIPIKLQDIAVFYIKNEVTHLCTFDNKIYYINKTLDEVQQLCGSNFYRANRQHIINRNAVKEVRHAQARKVSVSLSLSSMEEVVISKEKMHDFLEWLKG